MPMGTSACFDEVIKEKNIKKILGEHSRKLTSFKRLFAKVAENEGESSVREYLVDHSKNAVSHISEDILKLDALWTEIQAKVKEKTDLDLLLCYHNSGDDVGDACDEVDGLYFAFDNSQLYRPTEAFTNLMKLYGKKVVERKFYTVFG